MQDFIWKCPTEIVLGLSMADYVKSAIKKCGRRGVVISGEATLERISSIFSIRSLFDDMSVTFFSGVKPEASIEDVKMAILYAKEQTCDWIMAVGGGSVIDVAKVVALAVTQNIEAEEILNGKDICGRSLPLICIPTVIGSGAEVSRGCVIRMGRIKKSFSHDLLRPVLCYVVPEVFCFLSKQQILGGGTDAIVHVLERYFTNDLDNNFTDMYSISIIACLLENMKKILKNDCCSDVYAQMELAAMHANMGLAACGRTSDNTCHTVEHALGGLFVLPHTYGIVIILLQWLRMAWERKSFRINEIYEKLTGDKLTDFEVMIKKIEAVYQEYAVPVRLSQLINIKKEDIIKLADGLTNKGEKTVGKYIVLDKEDLVSLLKACY